MESESDYLSQLRASHFWLVLTSLGLLIAASLPRSAEYQRAYEQATQLTQINATLTTANLTSTFAAMNIPDLKKLDAASFAVDVPWHIGKVRCSYDANPKRPLTRPEIQFPDPVWIPDASQEAFAFPSALPGAFRVPIKERTLAQLMDMWAFLNNETRAFVVSGIAPDAESNAAESAVMTADADWLTNPAKHKCSVWNFVWSKVGHLSKDDASATVVLDGAYEEEDLDSSGKGGSGAGGNFTSAEIGIFTRPIAFPLLESHLRSYFNASDRQITATAGQEFEDAFPDLSRVAKGLESLRLHDLRAYIERQSQESGRDVEIFGAKLPVDVLREWGLPVLAVMQLYFLLHLRRFTARPRPASVSTFPWIAVYPGMASRAVTTSSVMLAPIAAVILCIEARGSGLSWWMWCLLALLITLSCSLAVQTARELLKISGALLPAPR